MKLLLVLVIAALLPLFNVVTSYSGICYLPHASHSSGRRKCNRKLKLWTYRADLNKCVRFRGCGDNYNQFSKK
uniref:BPTI/Kunitz inhibitor domain-containing protein n=1 Tax=Glossina palpalis gambiensis TaxID=67801 RepID=A0A1B0BCA4_9MUSC